MNRISTETVAQRSAGFTLIEFLVTLTVVAILIAIAAPNLSSFLQNSRLTTPANDLLHAFQFARTEAIKEQQHVAICASNNADDANATCSYGPFTGWIVFADTNNNWQRDISEPLLKSHSTVDSSVFVKTDNDGIMVYDSNGFGALPGTSGKVATTKITICDSRGNTTIGSGASAQTVARAIFVFGSSTPSTVRSNGRAWESKLHNDVTAAGGC